MLLFVLIISGLVDVCSLLLFVFVDDGGAGLLMVLFVFLLSERLLCVDAAAITCVCDVDVGGCWCYDVAVQCDCLMCCWRYRWCVGVVVSVWCCWSCCGLCPWLLLCLFVDAGGCCGDGVVCDRCCWMCCLWSLLFLLFVFGAGVGGGGGVV